MDKRQLTTIAAQAIAGDEGAFEKLYVEHIRSILFHVRSLIVDKENCYDVAQEAVFQMYKHIHQLREPAAFRGWMHQVVRTTCAAHNRTLLGKGENLTVEEVEEELEAIKDEDVSIDPEAATMAKLEGQRLFALTSQLTKAHQEVLALRFYDDLSYKEIAETLGTSVTNVSSRLKRAIEALRKILGETDAAVTAVSILDKGKGMKEDSGHSAYTQDIHTEEHLAKDDEGNTIAEIADVSFGKDGSIKQAYKGGVALLFPSEPVQELLASTKVKLASMGGASIAGGAAAASTLKYGTKIIIATVVTLLVAAAVVVGIVVVNTPADTSAPSESEQGAGAAYTGSMHLDFVDENGNGSDRNIVSATLVEEDTESKEITWTIYWVADNPGEDEASDEALNAQATELTSGNGSKVEGSTLSSLEPGYYLLSFTLTHEDGSTAKVKRNFIMTE